MQTRGQNRKGIKLSNIISFKITKSYYKIVYCIHTLPTPRRQIRLRRLYPLSRCPNFQKRVQDATSKAKASVERKSSQDGITRTLIFQVGKPRFPSAALQSSLPSPPSIVVPSCQVYSLPPSRRLEVCPPTKFNQPSLSTKDAGIRYQVTHFRPVTRDIPQRYAPLGTVASPVALLARKPIYHPNFARIIRCKRHTNGRLCAFGCHELVRLTPAG